ncbi:MAG: hypothetical protein IJF15_06185 [Oscillospiraceae bacterium]|nr:hypothetical protein [Oscillospiraceae bacterium]
MRRKIAIYSTMLVLLFALCACGGESGGGAADSTNTPPSQTQGGTSEKDGTSGQKAADGAKESLPNAARRAVDDAGDMIGDMVGGAVGGAAGAARGALDAGDDGMRGRTGPTKNAGSVGRFEQMVENGRVRDTDGFLADGENRSDNKMF